MELKEITQHLKCELTEDEIKEYGAELARKYSEITDLEDQKKSITSDFKARIDAANSDAGILARKIQNGYEFRDVFCEIQYIDDEKVVQTVRQDTGEIIKTRPMTPEEMQRDLFEEKEAKA